MRVLSDADVADLLDLAELLPVVETAFVRQGRGEVERPDRPHFPVGTGLDPDRPDEPLGTGLVMPAYVHGERHYATKLVGVHGGNPDRGLPTVTAQVVLNEAATGRPVAFLHGTRLTAARTGCIGGLAAREFAARPATVGVLGAGTQARWQVRAMAAATDVERVRVHSPSDSRRALARELAGELGHPVDPVAAPRDAVADADVVVTATTSDEPTFPADALADGTLVVAVGAYEPSAQEVPAGAFDRAAHLFADVPEEVARIGDVLAADVDPDRLVPLAAALDGRYERTVEPADVVLVESVGTAVLDAAVAAHVYEAAVDADVGAVVDG
ncbi:MAG: ornithine cyclodeaminase family protein [Haloferacaceae archaeon]